MEVNNLELVKALGILHEHVLGLEVSMANTIRVAVKHTRKNLLYNDGCVLLSETTSLLHLVKEVTTLTKLIDHIIALFIFKELVHAYNVGMVLYS